jgi:1-acyl-sn-glycerol-3-phosphate acyltransferase
MIDIVFHSHFSRVKNYKFLKVVILHYFLVISPNAVNINTPSSKKIELGLVSYGFKMTLFKKIMNLLTGAYLKIIMLVTATSFLLAGYLITIFAGKEKKKKVWRIIAKTDLMVYSLLCFIRIKTVSLDNIPKEPCVIAMNHRSLIDTLSMLKMMDKYFFVITEPFDALPNTIIQAWVSNLGFVPIVRDEKDKKLFKIGMDRKYVVAECVERVKAGETLVIYPEAHHEMHRGMLKFKTGAVRVALEAGVPLVPGVFTATDKIITPEHNRFHPGTIHIRFGEPMNIKKYYHKQNDRQLVRKLTKELKKKVNDLIP